MFFANYSIFEGANNEHGFTGFIADNHFFLCIEIEQASKELGNRFLDEIKNHIYTNEMRDLASFESFIDSAITTVNLPHTYSLAASFIKGHILYLKTHGTGQIYLHRKRSCAKIIEGDKNASGTLAKHDSFALTTSHLPSIVGGEDKFKKIFSAEDLDSIVKTFQKHTKTEDNAGTIGLFLLIDEKKEKKVQQKPQEVEPETTITVPTIQAHDTAEAVEEIEATQEGEDRPSRPNPFARIASFMPQDPEKRKKLLTILSISILFLILVWSVGLGYQRREEKRKSDLIKKTETSIQAKLQSAANASSTDISEAQSLLDDSKQELSSLKAEIGKEKSEDIRRIELLISDSERNILKMDEKAFAEFFDISVEDKEAKGASISLFSEDSVILDPGSSAVYVLSLTKKSLQKRTARDMASATIARLYNDVVYVFVPNKGIFTVDTENKTKYVISNDVEWGDIGDMAIFNGNIYLLDTSNGDVYKYLVAENVYSEKQSYFKGVPSVSLDDAHSITIDSSIYLALDDSIVKFTAGLQDAFTTTFPTPPHYLDKVFTTEEADNLYAWDKKAGGMYILNKKGEYIRQVQSSIFTKAEDLIVYGKKAYCLLDGKIYTVELD